MEEYSIILVMTVVRDRESESSKINRNYSSVTGDNGVQ